MAKKMNVGASVVREWAKSDEGQKFLAKFAQDKGMDVPTVGARGNFSQPLLDAFHEANPRRRYEIGHVPPRQIGGIRVSESGRKTPVRVSATLSEVRKWAQSQPDLNVGERGRISSKVLAAYAAAPRN